MAGKKKQEYTEDKIKTLSSLEHIRLRTGMYIGRTGNGDHYDDGIYILVKEVIDNGIDEFIMGHGSRIDVSIEGGMVTIRDFGRGIPLGKLVDCASKINTGAKYNDDVFQFSVGLNGVGTKAVNALSAFFLVRSHRDGRFAQAEFKAGILVREETGETSAPDGTLVTFSPDTEIFGNFAFHPDHLARRVRFYAYLNAKLKIRLNGEIFNCKGGLLDLICDESQFEKIYAPFHFADSTLEFSFTHTNRFSEEYHSFVNGQYTSDGGTHLSAFREGLLRGINDFSNKKIAGDDVREGILGAVAIRLREPIFESQTKNKLGNSDIRADLVSRIAKGVSQALHRDAAEAKKLVAKIEETRKLRKELNSVKKLAQERSKSVSIRIPQLKDCKHHFNREKNKHLETQIFITEGQSAAGSLVSCRDASTQAIFTLKGKPLNVCDLKRDTLYKNVEIYNLMRSLNIEESNTHLRYNHVILATDADVDGLHIRNLLITFFLRFFSPLVHAGHLKILETPLFRVRTRKETIYCYSEIDRETALDKLGRSAEITRFKGLGEISPGEFKDFISAGGIRLTPVSVEGETFTAEIVNFYMGKNTPDRREYIMGNLVVDTEML